MTTTKRDKAPVHVEKYGRHKGHPVDENDAYWKLHPKYNTEKKKHKRGDTFTVICMNSGCGCNAWSSRFTWNMYVRIRMRNMWCPHGLTQFDGNPKDHKHMLSITWILNIDWYQSTI